MFNQLVNKNSCKLLVGTPCIFTNQSSPILPSKKHPHTIFFLDLYGHKSSFVHPCALDAIGLFFWGANSSYLFSSSHNTFYHISFVPVLVLLGSLWPFLLPPWSQQWSFRYNPSIKTAAKQRSTAINSRRWLPSCPVYFRRDFRCLLPPSTILVTSTLTANR